MFDTDIVSMLNSILCPSDLCLSSEEFSPAPGESADNVIIMTRLSEKKKKIEYLIHT